MVWIVLEPVRTFGAPSSGGIVEHRKEAAVHPLSFRYRRHACEQRFVGSRPHPIAKCVDNHSPSRSTGTILERPMDEKRMMKGRLTRLQLDGDGFELLLLFIRKNGLDGLHIAGKPGYRQEIPAVTPWNVLNAAVLDRGVVQADPTGEMRERLGARPV